MYSLSGVTQAGHLVLPKQLHPWSRSIVNFDQLRAHVTFKWRVPQETRLAYVGKAVCHRFDRAVHSMCDFIFAAGSITQLSPPARPASGQRSSLESEQLPRLPWQDAKTQAQGGRNNTHTCSRCHARPARLKSKPEGFYGVHAKQGAGLVWEALPHCRASQIFVSAAHAGRWPTCVALNLRHSHSF